MRSLAILNLAWWFSISVTGAQSIGVLVDPGGSPRVPALLEARLAVGRDLDVDMARAFLAHPLSIHGEGMAAVPAQVEAELEDGTPSVLLVRWVEPRLVESGRRTLQAEGGEQSLHPSFHVRQGKGFRDLLLGARPVHREQVAWDAAHRAATYKTFHNVFGTLGKTLLTKGAGGLFPHHRGLFLGWSKTGCTTGTWDFWHCTKKATIRHERFVEDLERAGPVWARTVSDNVWMDGNDNPVVRDRRQVETWNLGDGRLVMDFFITLTAAKEPVTLQGDPQHAGFQFRAAQEVADRKGETVYVRPESARGGQNDVWENCPWVVSRFKIAGRPYAILHADHPQNPRPSVYSTRDYARFGAFFEGTLTSDKPLSLRYRVYVHDEQLHGVLDAAAWQATYDAWIQSPAVRPADR